MSFMYTPTIMSVVQKSPVEVLVLLFKSVCTSVLTPVLPVVFPVVSTTSLVLSLFGHFGILGMLIVICAEAKPANTIADMIASAVRCMYLVIITFPPWAGI